MFDNTIGIKLPVGDVSAKACMSIKAAVGLSLSEIKQRALADEFILLHDADDFDGLKQINELKRELSKHGIETRTFEDGEEVDPELLDNLETLYEDIDNDPYSD